MSDLENVQINLNTILDIIEFIFSAIVLGYISIIISGKLLAAVFLTTPWTGQIIRLPLIIINIQAENEEVIFGFSGFLVTLVIVSLLGGPEFVLFFQKKTGITLNQLDTLCVASALFCVIWSFTLFLFSRWSLTHDTQYKNRHQAMLDNVTKRTTPHSNQIVDNAQADISQNESLTNDSKGSAPNEDSSDASE